MSQPTMPASAQRNHRIVVIVLLVLVAIGWLLHVVPFTPFISAVHLGEVLRRVGLLLPEHTGPHHASR